VPNVLAATRLAEVLAVEVDLEHLLVVQIVLDHGAAHDDAARLYWPAGCSRVPGGATTP
jgi:hypothetical protein